MAARKPRSDPAETIRPLVSPEVRHLIDPLSELLRREAEKNNLTVTKVEVTEFIDPEEGDHKMVVRQWLDAAPHVALQYWDTLAVPLQTWIASLPTALQPIAEDQITVSVRYNAGSRPISSMRKEGISCLS